MTTSSRRRPSMGLRQAASVVFGLTAVLPILVLVSLLARADLLQRTDVQAGLVLAVAASALGFVLFRRLVGRIIRLAEGLRASGPGGAATIAVSDRAVSVPGLGQVAEVAQLTGSFYQMLEDLRGATQRLEDLVFKLGTLNETVELAARIPRIQDLLGLVLHTTMRAVRASLGAIMLYDPERQTLRTAASSGIPRDLVSDTEMKIDDATAGGVVRTGEPLLVEDMGADPRFHESDMSCYGTGAFIGMPIRAGDRVIGVINMTRRREESGPPPQPFSPIDLQFLNALMTSVGYAVDNARLLEEAQESARRLQKVVDDLKAAQEELVPGETVRAIGQLAAGMAHHLNNLFAVILGRTELLMGATTSAPGRRSLEIIRRAAEDGADVARRVQRFSRLHPCPRPYRWT
jgi:GAF domain-containing protein